MPLSIRKVTVNVSLCGAIPRSRLLSSARPSSTCENSQEELSLARCAKALRSQLTQLTSSQLNTTRPTLKQFVFSGCPVQAHENETLVSTRDRSKIIRTGTGTQPQPQLSEIPCTSKSHFSTTATDMKVQNAGADIGRKHRLAPSPAPIDPPQWAVPARGEAKLEVSKNTIVGQWFYIIFRQRRLLTFSLFYCYLFHSPYVKLTERILSLT